MFFAISTTTFHLFIYSEADIIELISPLVALHTCIIHTHVANMNNETGDLSSSTGTRHSLGILSFDIEQTSNCATTHMG